MGHKELPKASAQKKQERAGWQEGSHLLTAKERGLERNQSSWCLDPSSRLQNCEKISVYCLSHPLCGILFRHPSRLIQAVHTRHCAAPWGSPGNLYHWGEGYRRAQIPTPQSRTRHTGSKMPWEHQRSQNSSHLGDQEGVQKEASSELDLQRWANSNNHGMWGRQQSRETGLSEHEPGSCYTSDTCESNPSCHPPVDEAGGLQTWLNIRATWKAFRTTHRSSGSTPSLLNQEFQGRCPGIFSLTSVSGETISTSSSLKTPF